MSAKTVTVYIWPFAQKCFECENGFECIDNENGIITGIPNHPFALCVCSETKNDGVNCRSFHQKKEEP
jgi:hypothetical protein